jgi:uncharacterized membrane protein YeiH
LPAPIVDSQTPPHYHQGVTFDSFIFILDIFGTFAFAVSGAFKAVKYELDVLGLCVLSLLTGIGGGIIRDVVIGRLPPAVFGNELYFLVCLAGALLVFFLAPKIAVHWNFVLIADAIGLGVFSGTGALVAIDAKLGILGIVLLGTMTATGGGMLRDILVAEIPMIIKADFYATAAIIGCLAAGVMNWLNIDHTAILIVCIVLTTASRMVAIRLNLSLPRVKSLPASPSEMTELYHVGKKHNRRAGDDHDSRK